jgi:3-oxoacyl-[acyl-carrier protein] reductase
VRNMDLGLKNKVAFISGSSRGIGLAIARTFAAEGANVVITGRGEESLREAKMGISETRYGGAVLPIKGDMTDPGDIERALEKAVSTFGGLDSVVANVGSGTSRAGWELETRDWESALESNLLGGMALSSASLPRLIARGSGTLTFVSSIAGCEAISAPVAYSASKAAVQSAMKNLSRMVGPQGVRVNAVSPGNVLFPGGTWERKLGERRAFFENYIHQEVPLQRFGQPGEIADMVVFLASERASFVTGACVVVDGGQTRS